MWKMFVCLVGLLASAGLAKAQLSASEAAGLQQDVALMKQELGSLRLRVEQLENDNEKLRRQLAGSTQNVATVAQLNNAVSDLNQSIKQSASSTKTDVLKQVSTQMEKLAKDTNDSLNGLAKTVNAQRQTVSTPTFSDDFPKQGVTYTVGKGDTLSSIAKKQGAKVSDIMNANKIVDPKALQVGQTLFIPLNQ